MTIRTRDLIPEEATVNYLAMLAAGRIALHVDCGAILCLWRWSKSSPRAKEHGAAATTRRGRYHCH